ncbi:hypothetical protein, partial [Mesorhizobium sp. M0040]|uniref:hypothetical protein n=1 Tax=Mesorhizobium sp. M0040 TaxID=2956855 RepID=UPI00333E0CDD
IIASPQRKLDPSTPVLRFSWLPDAHVCGLHRMRTYNITISGHPNAPLKRHFGAKSMEFPACRQIGS